MQAPITPINEAQRLAALRRLNILDTPIEERFNRLTRLARRAFDVPMSTISLVDADRQWFKSAQGCRIRQTPRSVSFCGHTILSDNLMIIEDTRIDVRFADSPLVTGSQPVIFYAGCPILTFDGHRVGSLCVMSGSPRTFSPEDRVILRDLAAIVSSELEVQSSRSVQAEFIQDMAEVTRRSLLDSLTSVWNREGIEQIVECGMRHQPGGHCTLIICDADRFKAINDTHGHPVGDEVLQGLAQRLARILRPGDAVGRLGGEEFLVFVAPDVSVEDARGIAERMCAAVNESPIQTEHGLLDVTMSFGVVRARTGSEGNIREALELADRALYRAKHNGRNRVELVCQDVASRDAA